MSDDGTIQEPVAGIPVRALRVSVVGGPGEGQTATSYDEPITVGSAHGNRIVVDDRRVSRHHLEIDRAGDRIAVRDLGSTNGTRVGSAHFVDTIIRVDAGTTLSIGRTEIRVDDGDLITRPERASAPVAGIAGVSDAVQRVLTQIEALAAKDVSVLVVGESGVGKELVARALHQLGARADGPFVTLDCGAISPHLFESALFGHQRGAFTGADRDHQGAFARADTGTLLLDEIGELPRDMQSSLLGALERRRFTPVGGREEIACDVRVVAATNRDLRAEVNHDRFRLDLYYRLAVVTLTIPPLRDRPEDILVIAERLCAEEGETRALAEIFSPEELRRLQRHRWPGNVRELRNVVAAKIAIGETPPLGAGAERSESDLAELLTLSYREAKREVTDRFELRYLSGLLEDTGGNVLQASRRARMNRSYLIELMHKHGLKK